MQYLAHLKDEIVAEETPESAQGKGLAGRTWESYDRTMREALTPVFRPVAANVAADAMGFWLVWHLQGGFEACASWGCLVGRSTGT